MPLYEYDPSALTDVAKTTFQAQGIKEREHLQALLRDRIEVVAPDVLVVAEEFGDFEGANRRVDLLGVDQGGRLVVIELKRTEDGGHMELQALRYAAMVRTMTFAQLVATYEKHLAAHPPSDGEDDDAETRLLRWLDGGTLATEVRIVLVSADFGVEITGTVLWLNELGLDIRCVRLAPYAYQQSVLLDVQQVVPLPEAGDYQVKIRHKQALEKAGRTNHDYTKYVITDADGVATAPLPKRRAVLAMAQAVHAAGVPAEDIAAALGDSRCKRVPGHPAPGAAVAALQAAHSGIDVPRWWVEAPLAGVTDTFVVTKMWGLNTEQHLDGLAQLVPGGGVGYSPAP